MVWLRMGAKLPAFNRRGSERALLRPRRPTNPRLSYRWTGQLMAAFDLSKGRGPLRCIRGTPPPMG